MTTIETIDFVDAGFARVEWEDDPIVIEVVHRQHKAYTQQQFNEFKARLAVKRWERNRER